jgi:hypothetical protein
LVFFVLKKWNLIVDTFLLCIEKYRKRDWYFFIKKIKFNLRVLLWYVSRSIKYISLSDMFMTRYLSNFRVAMFHSTTQGLSFNNHEYLIPHKQKFDYFLSSFNIIFNVLKIIWIGMTNGIRVACFRVSDWIIHYLYSRRKPSSVEREGVCRGNPHFTNRFCKDELDLNFNFKIVRMS